MIVNVKFNGRTGRVEPSSFLLSSNEDLTVHFDIPEKRTGRYVAKFVHGTDELTVYLMKDKKAEIHAEWLNRAGAVPLEIFLELRDNTATQVYIPSAKDEEDKDGFFIEPLKVEEMPNGWRACGWLQALEQAFAELNEKLGSVSERLTKFEDEGVPLNFVE